MSHNKSGRELSGVRVAHDFTDFIEDRETILTLKDTYILTGQDVNRDIDVLENIHMSEDFRHQARQDNRKKKDGFLDEKYGAGEKKILPQYDEAPTEKEGILLDSTGEYSLTKLKNLESIRSKLSAPGKKNAEVSLETSKNVASEYYTSDEMKKFKKPMKKAVNVQKNKEDILKFLEESLGDTSEDHGSRDARGAREKADMDDVTTKKHKSENYQAALAKAREQSRYASLLDEEYDDIQRSIENQRRAAQSKKVNKVEEVIKTLMDSSLAENPVDTKQSKDVVVLTIPKKKPADGELVELDTINTATDFLQTVSTRDDMTEQKMKIIEPAAKSLKDTRDGTTSVVNISLPSERILAWNRAQTGLSSTKPVTKKETVAENGEEKTNGEKEKEPEEDMEKLVEETQFLEEEQLGGGVFAALKAAREKGMLMENEAEVAGRRKDKTYREELSKFQPSAGEDRVRLEYRDRNGRLMTPKEAFRYQCRIFHGINPSKNKQEKEKKKFEAAQKLLTTAPQETASMKTLQALQKTSNQAYVVLDTKPQK